jgi:sulfhydrogenase subunit beta (sulfur reductase)
VSDLIVGERGVLERRDFPAFFHALEKAGYEIVGPTVREGAIVYDRLSKVEDLPIGWTDQQGGGKYRLERRSDEALFGYNVGPFTWKKFLFLPHERLWTATRDGPGFTVAAEPDDGRSLAFLGMRACELAGLAITDTVFTGGAVADPSYQARRKRILRIGVQCGQAGGNCFCVSMGTGPGVSNGADLVLTELIRPGHHSFLLDVRTEAGQRAVTGVPVHRTTTAADAEAKSLVERTAQSMGKSMNTDGIRDLLLTNLDHPRWEIVAKRCLSCTNCTMVCPTCFCSTHEEVPKLGTDEVERWRRWDSCFNGQFSELHGQSVRKSTMSRYRQWLTHKLASWHDQFGTSGCVGCGRCITWCPVGIDLTEEVAAIRVPVTKPAGGKP